MEITSYKAEDLFEWVTTAGHDFTLLDVRNNEEFGRFKVEGPHLSKMINIPYIEFIEMEEESVAQVQVPKEESIRIVCAKEGSAKFVGEILVNNGWKDVRFLAEGIKSWGNMLAPKLVAAKNGYELYQFIRPGKASCSYGLIFEGEMAVFDPSRNTQFYQDFADEHGARPDGPVDDALVVGVLDGQEQALTDPQRRRQSQGLTHIQQRVQGAPLDERGDHVGPAVPPGGLPGNPVGVTADQEKHGHDLKSPGQPACPCAVLQHIADGDRSFIDVGGGDQPVADHHHADREGAKKVHVAVA